MQPLAERGQRGRRQHHKLRLLFIGAMDNISAQGERSINLKANGKSVPLNGTLVHMLPETLLVILKEKRQVESKWVKLRVYSGELIPTKEACELNVGGKILEKIIL